MLGSFPTTNVIHVDALWCVSYQLQNSVSDMLWYYDYTYGMSVSNFSYRYAMILCVVYQFQNSIKDMITVSKSTFTKMVCDMAHDMTPMSNSLIDWLCNQPRVHINLTWVIIMWTSNDWSAAERTNAAVSPIQCNLIFISLVCHDRLLY